MQAFLRRCRTGNWLSLEPTCLYPKLQRLGLYARVCKESMMSVLWTLLIVWCVWRTVSAIRASRAAQHAWEDAQWDCPDGAALKAFAQEFEQADRRARWIAPWREPWPWWFLGACLAFAGLCLGAGLWRWHTPDAPVLLLGGLLFGLACTFKAWAQEQAAPVPLRVRLRRRWRSRIHASCVRFLPVWPRVRPGVPGSTASRGQGLRRPLPLPGSSPHP